MSDFGYAKDDQGRDVMVGLSADETEFCSLYRHKLLLMEYLTKEEKARYCDLMARHDQHRQRKPNDSRGEHSSAPGKKTAS